MSRYFSHNKIYRLIATTLEKLSCKRDSLIKNVIDGFRLSDSELSDRSLDSVYSTLRSRIGTVITEMTGDNLIAEDSDGYYTLTAPKPVVIRIEGCEREIIRALGEEKMSKKALKERLSRVFGTNKTATHKDDERLYSYIGQITKRMISAGVITFSEGFYALSPKVSARVEDVNAILSLKSDFLHRLHEKGGEFFESYFMTLIKKHYEKNKRQIIECYVTGGSMDGGIDGIIKTRDELGFIETTMVQTKNRHELSSETDVRGFYGAVHAAGGTRGIFATVSGFHYSATKFLTALDDCIGINGEKIFALAMKLGYGIKRSAGKLSIDEKVL
jgi:restriction endonuclease Mrr